MSRADLCTPVYLHPGEGLHVKGVMFKKFPEGSASSGVVTS